MTKSRMAAVPLLLAGLSPLSPALAAEPILTAERAIQNQRDQLRGAAGIGCQRGEGEIVVCGRGGDPDMFPDEPGQRQRLIAGEAPAAGAAVALGTCCQPRGGIDLLRIGSVVAKGLGRIF